MIIPITSLRGLCNIRMNCNFLVRKKGHYNTQRVATEISISLPD